MQHTIACVEVTRLYKSLETILHVCTNRSKSIPSHRPSAIAICPIQIPTKISHSLRAWVVTCNCYKMFSSCINFIYMYCENKFSTLPPLVYLITCIFGLASIVRLANQISGLHSHVKLIQH